MVSNRYPVFALFFYVIAQAIRHDHSMFVTMVEFLTATDIECRSKQSITVKINGRLISGSSK